MIPIKEYITFGDFNSKEMGLYLMSREAPTPDEQTIVESIPGMQGVLDFSGIYGERIFDNREITYQFKLINKPYDKRKYYETAIKQALMPYGNQMLFDSFNGRYYWHGKCKSVKVEHDARKRNFIATLVFDCYPFMYAQNDYYDDVWDTFSFDQDVTAFTKFSVQGSRDIVLFNAGSTSLSPEIEATASFVVTDEDGKDYRFNQGTSTDFTLQLKKGINRFKLKGTGTIAFHFRVEVMG
ncbi:hypothetical protein [Streptococcus sp. zg-JUN1979]|uniref:hypothetical protein n=1 Tax=Streptococcus sp. zg-JUN1979 TaxID=3391450 RepID=UPI0039A75498